jgi:hypothetical protein
VIDERTVARFRSGRDLAPHRLLLQPGADEGRVRSRPTGAARCRAAPGGRCAARRSAGVVDDYLSLVGLPTGGAVRVPLGIASTIDDVDAFLDFAERTYRDRHPDLAGLAPGTAAN